MKALTLIFGILIFCSCSFDKGFTRHRYYSPSARFAGKEQSFSGICSYYGKKFHGKKTANGETFDMYGFTAAHPDLPFGTKLEIKNLSNNKKVIVRVNDRGPFVKGRILDLSYAAADAIGMISAGTAEIEAQIIFKPEEK